MQVGDKIRIVSLKYLNKTHRVWEDSFVLKTGDPLIVANNNTKVIEANGKNWHFQGLAICLFSKHNWFNVIMIYHPPLWSPTYYCNIASPYCFDPKQKSIRYIDLDIDVIVKPNEKLGKVVDWDEWLTNREKYHYPVKIMKRAEKAVGQLFEWMNFNKDPFNSSFSEYWYHQYFLLSEKV